MTSEKVEDYNGGEIHQMPNGSYIFVHGNTHAGAFATVDDLKRIIGRSTETESAKSELVPNDIDVETKNQERKSSDTKAKKTNKKG